MKRLPHVEDLIGLIHEKTAEAIDKTPAPQEKVAHMEFMVPIAGELQKVAQKLREHDATAITYADVQKFAMQLMEAN
jgi:hypothetical protein